MTRDQILDANDVSVNMPWFHLRPGHRMVGSCKDPVVIVDVSESREYPGYFDVAAHDATAGITTFTKRPIRGTTETGRYLIAMAAKHCSGGVDLDWRIEECRPAINTCSPSIYFIADEDGYIKIGKADDAYSRLRCLQTAARQELRLLAVTPGGYSEESELHQRFAAHRVRGEWFRPSRDLLDYIAQVP